MSFVRYGNGVRRSLSGGLVLAVGAAGLAAAGPVLPLGAAQQVGIEVELEGRVTGIGSAKGPRLISVMGVEVDILEGVPIFSPVTGLSFADLLGAPFPGREEPGFLGGTGIILGVTDDGETVATEVFVEPDENVLIGEVTANVDGQLWILGLEVDLIEDWRMFGTAWTESGFLVDLPTVNVGTFGVAEGYFGNDGIFHAFLIEAKGDILGPDDQTSITRASCRPETNIEVRGGSTDSTGLIEIYDDETDELLGVAIVFPDEDEPRFGQYRFRSDIEGDCPVRVRAENSNGSQAIADVEIE